MGLLPAFMASRHPELIRLLPREVDIDLTSRWQQGAKV
jgi:hypothetical protein